MRRLRPGVVGGCGGLGKCGGRDGRQGVEGGGVTGVNEVRGVGGVKGGGGGVEGRGVPSSSVAGGCPVWGAGKALLVAVSRWRAVVGLSLKCKVLGTVGMVGLARRYHPANTTGETTIIFLGICGLMAPLLLMAPLSREEYFGVM
ncbi:hypothetical protein Tco_0984738 [Tanacetum coccineum]